MLQPQHEQLVIPNNAVATKDTFTTLTTSQPPCGQLLTIDAPTTETYSINSLKSSYDHNILIDTSAAISAAPLSLATYINMV
eukprot:5957039-Amphidinium_carterae.1